MKKSILSIEGVYTLNKSELKSISGAYSSWCDSDLDCPEDHSCACGGCLAFDVEDDPFYWRC
ncbi:hypothetical protein [Tenacibaculum sp. M341]|uniref:hypothetical protein n=1 Tax=Tenacibaculum sp. M341 TaxID=2530339 RepID=UPI0010460778|nr:hypothetical protein [Tenacibaculum sp. M341]TCI93059.1 hypothetical protein EYW44_05425 [Tenacibaculum sp. M341]